MDRTDPLLRLLDGDTVIADFVRILVIDAKGSTPRGRGTAMSVWPGEINETIGGGRLEFEAIATARRWLARDEGISKWQRETQTVALGPALGQCCGGQVTLLFERFGVEERETMTRLGVESRQGRQRSEIANQKIVHPLTSGAALRIVEKDGYAAQKSETSNVVEAIATLATPLFVYGAGHVGRALVPIVASLDFEVYWIDTSADRFPVSLPQNVERLVAAKPELLPAQAPADAFHVVMTYGHDLDLAICHAVLSRGEFGFLGLIGSQTKSERFRRRLLQAGLEDRVVSDLTCPIGLLGVGGKSPTEIAVSIAAQLISETQRHSA